MNINDIFTAKVDRTAALANLAEALTCTEVYNVDYVQIKDQINRALDSAWDKYVRQTWLGLPHDLRNDFDEAISELYYNHPQSHTLGSTAKKVARAEKVTHGTVVTDQARAFVDATAQLAEDMKAVKLLVVKTRKPSATPRLTEARTIENTGTCSVCERNAKLNIRGQIVSHGYRVVWQQHQGPCFGHRELPIEVSPEGAVKYLDVLRVSRTHEDSERLIAELELAETEIGNARRKLLHKVRQHQNTVRYLDSDIKRFEAKVAGWEPTPLPGA